MIFSAKDKYRINLYFCNYMPHVDNNMSDMEFQQLTMEFRELRNEILKRIELRQQVLVITLTIAGVIFGLGVRDNATGYNNQITLIYPPISLLMAMIWIIDDYNIQKASLYIQYRIERKLPTLMWEKYTEYVTYGSKDKYVRLGTSFAYCGIFITTQLIALLIGGQLGEVFKKLVNFEICNTFEFWGTVSGVLSIIITVYFFLMWYEKKRSNLVEITKRFLNEAETACIDNPKK
jgi:hypothetical protein